MSEEIKTCLVCKSLKFEKLGVKNSFILKKCLNCDYVFCSNPPNEKELGKYYNSSSEKNKKITKKINDFFGVRWISRKFNKHIKQKSEVLDFGCGSGAILAQLKKKGHSVEGIEICKECRDSAKIKYGLDIYENLEAANFSKKFDVIIMKSVLEHLITPNKYIQKLSNFLKKEGILIIKLPNIESLDFKKLGLNWRIACPPVHLNYFNKTNICLFLEQFGYKVISIEDSRIPSYVFPYNLPKIISIPLKIAKLVKERITSSNIQGSNLYLIAKKEQT